MISAVETGSNEAEVVETTETTVMNEVNEMSDMEAIIGEAISQVVNEHTTNENTEPAVTEAAETGIVETETVEIEAKVVEVDNQLVADQTPVLAEAKVAENDTDGPRAKHLKQALRKALNNTIKSCRYTRE